jgi:hypothetical protein
MGGPTPRASGWSGSIGACDKLARLRGPGESYSDVVLQLVEMEAKGRR